MLPYGMQNLIFSMFGYYNYRLRFGREYERHLSRLLSLEFKSNIEIQEFQNARLSEIGRIAGTQVPFYREIYSEAQLRLLNSGLNEDTLSQLPIIDKSILRSTKSAYFNTSIKPRNLIEIKTSGTSGRPLTVYHTRDSIAHQWAVWGRHKARFGIDQKRSSRLTFGARVPVHAKQERPPFWRINYAMNQTYLSIYHLSPRHMGDIVEYINSRSFEYFDGYPSAMYLLACYMKENRLSFDNPPKMIITGSDVLLPKHIETLESVFSSKVTEQYGMAEACGNFSKCELGRFHLDYEFGYVEYLDIVDLPESPYKRLVFTGFSNRAMPLIRYDVGDLCIPSGNKCSCGRVSPCIDQLSGREEDYIVTPEGRRIQGFNQVLEWAEGTREIQIIQEDRKSINVNIVPNESYNELRDLRLLDSEFRKRLGHEVTINYHLVESIEKTKMGKYKAVISLLSDD